MGAAAFVGRVGGLAIALGVGVLAGIPVAAADGGSGGPSTDASAASTDTPRATGRNTGRQTRPDRDARRSDQRPGDRRSPAGAPPSATTPPERPAEPAAAVVVPEAKPVAVAQDQDQDQGRAEAPAGAAAVAVTEPDQPAQADAAAHVPAPLAVVTPSQVPSAAPPAAEPAEVTALATASQGGLPDPRAGGAPGGTGESPLSWATLAFARRQIGNTASATAATAGITVNPDVVWSDGVLVGSLDATSGRDLPLTYAVVDRPSLGGKLTWEPRPTGGAPTGRFAYLPDMSTLTNPGQSESFAVLVAEETAFDTFIKGIPLIGALFDPLLKTLHQVPFLSSLLAPIIGSALVVDFTESAATLAAGRPVAFTHLMRSFDDTPISVNYFPATNVATGETSSAPTILNGPELGFPGNTDPFSEWDTSLVNIVPGINPLRTDASPFAGGYSGGGGYNVITWDPRGEYASGGRMQLDNPNFEGRDVSAIITWATSAANVARSQVATDQSGDPFIGMVGGSYGGGIQLAVAGTPDKRVDAIVPSIAWNTLNESLYLNNTFKTTIGSELLLALAVTGARINNQIYAGILSGSLLGFLSSDSQALLTNAGPGLLVKNIQAPTLFIQGIPDILFELGAAMINGGIMALANPAVPVKTTWFCGGHGVCLLPPALQRQQGELNMSDTLRWLDQYVAGNGKPADAIPTFQWFDQTGQYHSAALAPFDPKFNNPVPLRYSGDGGPLVIVPLLGGSGPSEAAVPPETPTVFSTAFALASGSKARNALNSAVTPPVGTQIAGAPVLSFSYSGLGTSRAVYAQLVDNATGLVLGNVVTPIPVKLDGRKHTVTIPMAAIAYSVNTASDSMTLQITSSALPYADLTAWGFINIDSVDLAVPTVA